MSKKRNNDFVDHEAERKRMHALKKKQEERYTNEEEYDDEGIEEYAEMASDYLHRHGY